MAELFSDQQFAFRIEFLFCGNIADVLVGSLQTSDPQSCELVVHRSSAISAEKLHLAEAPLASMTRLA